MKNILFIFLVCFMSTYAQKAEEWPKTIDSGNQNITIYEPENSTYIDHKLKSKAAISIKSDQGTPVFGMVWTTSLLEADRTNRTASLVSIKVDEVRFPDTISDSQKETYKNIIEEGVPKWRIEVSMDYLVNSLETVSSHLNELNTDARKFIFATEPSVLIVIDGKPTFKQAESNYQILQNSSSLIVKDPKKDNLYLKGGAFWYQSRSIDGIWKETNKVPNKIEKIAKEAAPEKNDEEEASYNGTAPKIIIGDAKTELININGEPSYAPLQKTNLLYVKNSETDLFMEVTKQKYYILSAGRWFTAKDVKGPWSFISSDNLPSDFSEIDVDSDKGHILANVAGTKEAKNAVYDAQIPQTAAVNRADTKASKVSYDGQANFEKVKGINLEYAVNTESSVFKDGSTYYLCDNAVWFIATNPNGPWKVSDNRPEEIHKVPSSNPKYHTKYVYIYETTPQVVYVGYTPGYYGSYIYHHTVVYGTGHYYNPWYNGYYYHHHYTYGFNIRYDYWNGWSFGFSYGSPYYWRGYNYWRPGWNHWGPHYYRPPYYHNNHHYRPYRPPYHRRDGVTNYVRPSNNRPNRRPTPTVNPNTRPTVKPNTRPNTRPAVNPNTKPTVKPNTRPTVKPNTRPAVHPNTKPTVKPNTRPAVHPNTKPAVKPSTRPTVKPSTRPAVRPNTKPTVRPNTRPSTRPSRPTYRPSTRPYTRPSRPTTRTSPRTSTRPMTRNNTVQRNR